MPDLSSLFLVVQIAILIFSIVIHEFSHGAMAYWLGDSTAKYAGRLTLNPIPHIDPIGSILVPLIMAFSGIGIIGWAKPVPYNPYNLRDQKYGPALVGLAGPLSNLVLAVVFGIIIRIAVGQGMAVDSPVLLFFGLIVFFNVLLAVFNLVPIPPLDGSKILFYILPYRMQWLRDALERNGILILALFIFFGFRLIFPVIIYLFVFITGSVELLVSVFRILI